MPVFRGLWHDADHRLIERVGLDPGEAAAQQPQRVKRGALGNRLALRRADVFDGVIDRITQALASSRKTTAGRKAPFASRAFHALFASRKAEEMKQEEPAARSA